MSTVANTVETGTDSVALVAVYRRILTWLGIGTALGACVELAMLRHWHDAGQLVPWAVLAVLLAAAAAWLVRRSVATARIMQGTAIVAVLGSAFGVYEHIGANLAAGPLSGRYSAVWDSMSAVSQLWAAATGSVGASPVLAPGMVGLAGVLLWLAAFRWVPARD
ncbi:hypothetical protein [Arthrobacter sp. Marseille-P9274]|uniref:hypothetical protein n=1 Tax=Arthrobacter sp. Marseille-P9274 TaxID=2866572 RepID=UPI0021C734D8|nr:hypothetical protein [Arthrobacter sp. Marseille-P9274]